MGTGGETRGGRNRKGRRGGGLRGAGAGAGAGAVRSSVEYESGGWMGKGSVRL